LAQEGPPGRELGLQLALTTTSREPNLGCGLMA
jgi:hypothetical protein